LGARYAYALVRLTLARLKEQYWAPLALQPPVRMEVVEKKRLPLARC